VLPVILEPGRTYANAIGLNSQRFRTFDGACGQSAVPYLLLFKTKG
jgi:RNA polymerase sigma-70 factor (ECF subfamily)